LNIDKSVTFEEKTMMPKQRSPFSFFCVHVDTTSARVFKDSKQRCQDLYIRAKWYGLVHQFMRKLGAKEWYIVLQEEDIIKAEKYAATITI